MPYMISVCCVVWTHPSRGSVLTSMQLILQNSFIQALLESSSVSVHPRCFILLSLWKDSFEFQETRGDQMTMLFVPVLFFFSFRRHHSIGFWAPLETARVWVPWLHGWPVLSLSLVWSYRVCLHVGYLLILFFISSWKFSSILSKHFFPFSPWSPEEIRVKSSCIIHLPHPSRVLSSLFSVLGDFFTCSLEFVNLCHLCVIW